MKKRFAFIFFTLICSISLYSQKAEFNIPDKAVLEKHVLDIKGPWDFYWEKFIDCNDMTTQSDLQVIIPKEWNNYEVSNDKDVIKKGKGSATYRIKINNLKKNTKYSFNTYRLGYTAFTIYVNGQKIYQSGVPDVDYEKTKPQQYMDCATFESDDNGQAVMTIHVSNEIYRKGGIRKAVKLMEADSYIDHFNRKLIYNSILCGVFFIIILYLLILFFLNHSVSHIYLLLFVLGILLRIISAEFSLIKLCSPDFPFIIILRLEYIAVFFSPACYTLYIDSMNKDVFRYIKAIYIALPGFILLPLDLFAPIYIVNRLVPVMQIYMFIVVLLNCIMLFLQIIKNRDLISIASLSTFVIIGIGALLDIMGVNNYINVDIKLLTLSFAIYATFQTMFLAYLQNRNLTRVKTLNKYLTETNNAYYRFVPKEFLNLLSKNDITEVQPGECIQSKGAILSADIRNFTSISEKMNEMQVFKMLNEYLKEIAPIIRKHGGVIEKYLGDGIVAIFINGASSALNCAVEMQNTMVGLRKRFMQQDLPEIKIGVGIHYGNITLGVGGNEQRMTEISLSPDIDIAIQTESLTKVYQSPIIVTKEAYSHAIKEYNEKKQSYNFNVAENEQDKHLYFIYNDIFGVEL